MNNNRNNEESESFLSNIWRNVIMGRKLECLGRDNLNSSYVKEDRCVEREL